MSKTKISLGRGLGAILEEVEKAYQNDLSQNIDRIKTLKIDEIVPNPFQPRKNFSEESLQELSNSIKTYGLLQPIVVYEDSGTFVLIAGERRVRATKLAGFDEIEAIIADIDPKKLRELALIENIQREDLNPIELAESYKELIENYSITHEELAEVLHKSRAQITNTLRLLTLSEQTKESIVAGRISHGHAKVLVGLPESEQKVAVDSIVGQKLTVRETERMVKSLKEKNGTAEKTYGMEEKDFYERLETLAKKIKKAGISSKVSNNRLVLEFADLKNLDFFIKNFLRDDFVKSNI